MALQQQDGGMVMQDLAGLRGNLLLGHTAAVSFTHTNLVGGHQAVSETDFELHLCGGGSSERHICCLWGFFFFFFRESEPPGSMGGALLCWGAAAVAVAAAAVAEWVTTVQLCAIRHSESAELPGTLSAGPLRWMNECEERPCKIRRQKSEPATVESLTWKYTSDRSKLVDA